MDKKCVPKPGDWVLLKGDSVIACGRDVKRLMDMALADTSDEMVISKEPISQHCYY